MIQAVDATRGQVVSYNGKVCNTFFGASNGGQTELPGNAFGGGSSKNAQYPYLVQKDDPYDLANTASREQMFLIPKQIDSVTGDVVVVNKGCTNVRVRSATNTSDNTNILAEVDGGASFPYVGETGDWYIILYNGKNAYISKQFTAKQNNGGSGNFPYSYASSQLNALQKRCTMRGQQQCIQPKQHTAGQRAEHQKRYGAMARHRQPLLCYGNGGGQRALFE